MTSPVTDRSHPPRGKTTASSGRNCNKLRLHQPHIVLRNLLHSPYYNHDTLPLYVNMHLFSSKSKPSATDTLDNAADTDAYPGGPSPDSTQFMAQNASTVSDTYGGGSRGIDQVDQTRITDPVDEMQPGFTADPIDEGLSGGADVARQPSVAGAGSPLPIRHAPTDQRGFESPSHAEPQPLTIQEESAGQVGNPGNSRANDTMSNKGSGFQPFGVRDDPNAAIASPTNAYDAQNAPIIESSPRSAIAPGQHDAPISGGLARNASVSQQADGFQQASVGVNNAGKTGVEDASGGAFVGGAATASMAQREIDPTVQQRMSAADEGLGQKSRAKIAKEERESLLLSA